MPLYEYRCLDCKKRCTILELSVTNPKPVVCPNCQSSRLERILSLFAAPTSEEARLESLSDPNALAGLDENDPESMERFTKKMGDEMGEDLSEGMAESMESSGESASDLDGSDSL